MSSHTPDPAAIIAAATFPELGLSDLDYAILRVTSDRSLSTIAIAETIGRGYEPTVVVPLLERLERLELLDGYFAAGRSTGGLAETHRRYYRSSDLGRMVVTAVAAAAVA